MPIYFKCYNMHDDMNRVPKEIMNSIRKNKVGSWVDRRESFVLFGHGCLGLELACLLPWVSQFGAEVLEWSRSKRETKSERIQGAERDIWVRFVSLVFCFYYFFIIGFFI